MKSGCCDWQVAWSYNEMIYEGNCLIKLKPHYICLHCLREVGVDPHEVYIDGDGFIISPIKNVINFL